MVDSSELRAVDGEECPITVPISHRRYAGMQCSGDHSVKILGVVPAHNVKLSGHTYSFAIFVPEPDDAQLS